MRRPDLPGWFPRDAAVCWQRVRRYAVPRWMIEQATERRLAGDWRGACRVALVDVAFDLAEVGRRYGPGVADRLEADLGHFAPDLLRWHLPRALPPNTTFAAGLVVPLATYPGPVTPSLSAPCLVARTPPRVGDPQRVRLEVLPERPADNAYALDGHRHLFDARHTGELRARCGGGDAATERLTALQDRGLWEQAWEAAGLRPCGETGPDSWYGHVALSRLRAEAGLPPAGSAPDCAPARVLLEIRRRRVRRVAVSTESRIDGAELPPWLWLPYASWRRLPDLDLLRFGLVEPDDLHPLVHDALFPGRTVAGRAPGPPEVEPPGPVMITCGDTEHPLGMRGGRLAPMPDSGGRLCREHVLGALGGERSDCDKVAELWAAEMRGRSIWPTPKVSAKLPRVLLDKRYELFELARHGDAPAVVRWLDAGFDSHVREGCRPRTLISYLPWLDHEEVLQRLVAAGVTVDTAAIRAAVRFGSADLIRSLLDAAPRRVNQWGWSLHSYCAEEIWWSRRRDLQFVWDYVL